MKNVCLVFLVVVAASFGQSQESVQYEQAFRTWEAQNHKLEGLKKLQGNNARAILDDTVRALESYIGAKRMVWNSLLQMEANFRDQLMSAQSQSHLDPAVVKTSLLERRATLTAMKDRATQEKARIQPGGAGAVRIEQLNLQLQSLDRALFAVNEAYIAVDQAASLRGRGESAQKAAVAQSATMVAYYRAHLELIDEEKSAWLEYYNSLANEIHRRSRQ